MARQPAGDAALTDEDLDAAVQSMFEDDEAPTAAPEPAPPGDAAAEAVVEPEQADEPAEAAAGDAPPADAPETRPAEEPPPAAVPTIPAGAKPFQFKASGSVQTLPGAHELPDGSVLVTKDALTELRRTFANERDLSQSFKQTKREFDRRIQQAQTQRTEKDAQADAAIALVAELVQKSPEEQWQYLQEFAGNIPRLQLDLERKQLDERKRMLEEQQRGPQLSPEEQQEQFTTAVQGELAATWQFVEQSDEFKALTAQQKQVVRARYEKNPARLVRKATQDDPAAGVKKGDDLFDPTDLLDDLRFLVQSRPATPSPTAAARNAALNADQQQKSVNPIPPAVRSSPPQAQQPRDKQGKFTDRKKFREDFLKDDDEAA